jgi:hypothetical protein
MILILSEVSDEMTDIVCHLLSDHFLPKSFKKWIKMLQKSDFLRNFVSFYHEGAHYFLSKMYCILTKMFQKRTKTSQNVNNC